MTTAQLADLLPAAAALLGMPGPPAAAELLDPVLGSAGRAPRHVVVLLVDGLGALQLAEHPAIAPRLSAMADLGPLSSPFPSTTSVSLTSLGTGLAPGMHGIVGTSFRLDDGSVLSPLSWGHDPNPIVTQPEPTVLERAAAAGILVTTAAPSAHRSSGLTRAALRGGDYPGADSLTKRLEVTAQALDRARAEGRTSLTYVYWPDLDKAGHVYGVASGAYRAELARVDSLVTGLADLAGDDVLVLVTADHGLIDVPDEHRFDLESRPALRRGVATILGEPRVRHVYTDPGQADQVLRTWADELGDRAEVRTRADTEELLGPVDEWYADRVGDVVAIARADWGLVSQRIDRVVSGLRGQHGSTTDAEMHIPLRGAGGSLGAPGR